MSDDSLDIQGRVKVLEISVHKVETRMEAGFRDLSKQFSTIAEKLNGAPRTIPFKEIAATVAVCLGIFAYAGNYLEGQYKKNISVLEYRVEQLEKTARGK